MTRYRATIVSPKGAAPKSSVIEFESEHRAGSKLNLQDARYKMLELHGSEALSWNIKDIEKVTETERVEQQSSLCLIFANLLSLLRGNVARLSGVLPDKKLKKPDKSLNKKRDKQALRVRAALKIFS